MATCDAMTTLAVDIGQSGSRLALGGEREGWRLIDGAPIVAGEEPTAAIAAIVKRALATLSGPPERIEVVSVGLSGLNGRPPPAAELHRRLQASIGVAQTRLADDSVTSYLGAIGTNAGAVVAAGTGAVVLAADGRGAWAHVDGAGYLISDAGSGYWIGRAGLESAWRAHDGRGGSEALLAAASSRFGELATLPARLALRPDRVSEIASFTQNVAEAADAGDVNALEIWASAGTELARSTHAALRRCGLERAAIEVSLTGALAASGELLLAPFRSALAEACPLARYVAPLGTSLEGAMRLATAPATAFGSLVASAST